LGQAPSQPLIFQGFRRFRSEPVPFFRSLAVYRTGAGDLNYPTADDPRGSDIWSFLSAAAVLAWICLC
jgi:hypothetical protein